MSGDETGHWLYQRWYQDSVDTLRRWAAAGLVNTGPDPETRAAILLSHDLSSLLLREHITGAIGVDPFTGRGIQLWISEVTKLYSGDLWNVADDDDIADNQR